ncbi:MAG: PilC/PilY family type IV pilus protein [Steroidobacteraceae bacterium]
MTLKTFPRTGLLAAFAALTALALQATPGVNAATPVPPKPPGGTLGLAGKPLFLNDSVAPLNMLVVGRDHKLYYEAYNDASDLNGDGILDVGFKPSITYYGLFDSAKCYNYGAGGFVPTALAGPANTCTGQWSGNFMNYVTTARIDALRKVLYGGSRRTDTDTVTILQRTHIPQDAHSWGKEYESIARDGYDITQYTPLAMPTPGSRHLIANTTRLNDPNQLPLMRVLLNRNARIWNWVSKERPVAEDSIDTLGNGQVPTDYTVRVQVCLPGLLEVNCQQYPHGNYKPVGLLQEHGANDKMLFGLLTGSYAKNTRGGVLRKAVGTISDEIDATDGTFKPLVGIIRNLDQLRTTGFGGSYEYSCGWVTTGAINRFGGNGQCNMWGNPIGEMMYETLRYFAGQGAPTAAFDYGGGSVDATLGLTKGNWQDPYTTYPSCSKPFETVISDINPSYDTDEVPGTAFNDVGSTAPADDLGGFNAATEAQAIWDTEFGAGAVGNYFIGQSGGIADGAPTAKTVTGFANIRGLAPEEPTKMGGYYSASAAFYGLKNDLNPAAAGAQKLRTFAVALASPLPKIEIPVNGHKITLVPFAKTVWGAWPVGSNVTPNGPFQPTNQIVDFYVESITPTSGSFRVNFEDVEQGADHDMDAIVRYDYVVNADNTVDISLTSEYAAGGYVQHLGYVISGTTADGTYLEVRDADTNPNRNPGNSWDVAYALDTPPLVPTAAQVADGGHLPFSATRTFSPGTSGAASLLKDPLWYAAKFGGFNDLNNDDTPQTAEWDADNNGVPDNYFLVTNALTLKDQLATAFDSIQKYAGSASAASVNTASISSSSKVYQSLFNTGDWSGDIKAYPFQADGTIGSVVWKTSEHVPAPGARKLFTVNSAGVATPLQWAAIGAFRQAELDPLADGRGADRLDYLRGERTYEQRNSGTTGASFRNRALDNVLGDFVSSAPAYVAEPDGRFGNVIPEASSYLAFRASKQSRPATLYAGSNDGMLHAFDADTGDERWAFIPGAVFRNLHNLTNPTYSHQYFVDGAATDGDAFVGGSWKTYLVSGLNAGGQSVFALDITDPSASSEANAASKFRWEFSDADDADMGYSYSRPAIARMANGDWVAIFGNGYNNTVTDGSVSTTGNAVLYVVRLSDGQLLRKIDTGVGVAQDPYAIGRPNGLSTVGVVDANQDAIADYAYAGDLFGNLWKFDLTSGTPSSWDVAYRVGPSKLPLFVARDANGLRQAITARPVVGRGPGGDGLMVLFGTGKFLEARDRIPTNLQMNTFYGLLDKNTGAGATDIIINRGQLLQQSITSERIVTVTDDGPPVKTVNAKIRVTSQNPIVTERGWFMDMESPDLGFQGEMIPSNPFLRNKRVNFTTLIPDPDPCTYGGSSWLMNLDMFSGARIDTSPFDLNQDGDFNSEDKVPPDSVPSNDGGGGGSGDVAVSGLQIGEGIVAQGIVVGDPSRDRDLIIAPDSFGNVNAIPAWPGPGVYGRQSWRQLR